eukprot:jgi/Undpi1/3568/HiC_scaffold_16.g06940.m1
MWPRQAESVVAQSARALSKVFEGMYNKINPKDFNYAREPNVDERLKFSRDIYRVEDSQLAEVVDLLEQRCPDAVVRDNEEGYFVVKVDALPPPVFWEAELYLRMRERLGGGGVGVKRSGGSSGSSSSRSGNGLLVGAGSVSALEGGAGGLHRAVPGLLEGPADTSLRERTGGAAAAGTGTVGKRQRGTGSGF